MGFCSNQSLPPYGACLLGSINPARLVRDPFTPAVRIDASELGIRPVMAALLG